jgi:hypothetical protein
MSVQSQIVIYEAEDGQTRIEVHLEQGTVWLSQAQIAELFGTGRSAITKHLSNIFLSNELDKNSVCSILERTAADGKSYKTQYYNLDAIISVGYRVNSVNATRFRIWANRILKDYLVQGYSINQERCKTAAHRGRSASHFLFGESDQSHGAGFRRSLHVHVIECPRQSLFRAAALTWHPCPGIARFAVHANLPGNNSFLGASNSAGATSCREGVFLMYKEFLNGYS